MGKLDERNHPQRCKPDCSSRMKILVRLYFQYSIQSLFFLPCNCDSTYPIYTQLAQKDVFSPAILHRLNSPFLCAIVSLGELKHSPAYRQDFHEP